ncbi:MAG: lysophospholipid acyltransferase family protein [bacterium]|nr:lysophospholipid acyltransferase family protein [bacterium]
MSIWKNFTNWLAAGLLYLVVRLITATCTIVVELGKEHLDDLVENPRPAVFSFWHNNMFILLYYFSARVIPRGIPLNVLVSQSNDGEFMSHTANLFGAKTTRGSSTRGGREAFQALLKTIKRDQRSVIMAPDGPKGPVYKFQFGTAILSQSTGAPIVPIGYACTRAWPFRSWDQFFIPKPFSKIAMSIGEPYIVPRKLDGEGGQEAERQQLEERMMAMVRRAEDYLEEKYGRVDSRVDMDQAAAYQKRKAEREALKHSPPKTA